LSNIETKLPSLYQPQAVAELLTPETISKLLLGFTAGLEWMGTALQEFGGERHDLWGTPQKYWCKFCVALRKGMGKESSCVAWDKKVAQVLLGQVSEDYPGQREQFTGIFRCHAGMIDFAEIIHLAGRPFAVLHGGQLVPKDDPSWSQGVRSSIKKTEMGLMEEQIDTLLALGLAEGPWLVIALRISNAIATAKKGAIRIVGYTNGGAAGTNADDRFPRPVRPSTRLACPAGHWRARS
jgi:hypothetical protein